MAEGETIRPGSWVGDTAEEFKKLPTWGKIGIGAVVLGVAGFAYWQWKQSSTGTAGTAGTSGTAGMGIPGGATDSGQSGTPTGPTTPTTPTTGPAPGPVKLPGPGPVTPTPTPTPTKPTKPKLSTYTVQRGDNLSGIASKLHLAGGWQALYNANKAIIGSNPNLIYAGTKLQVPA